MPRGNPVTPPEVLERIKAWGRAHPEKLREYARRRRERHLAGEKRVVRNRKDTVLRNEYGISLVEFEQMVSKQDGKCAICGRVPSRSPLNIDHDHATGVVRGLLCGSCNRGIGLLQDNPVVIESASAYLRSFSAQG